MRVLNRDSQQVRIYHLIMKRTITGKSKERKLDEIIINTFYMVPSMHGTSADYTPPTMLLGRKKTEYNTMDFSG